MVKIESIIKSNNEFASQHHTGKVCVFAGATAGIGFGTLRRMVTMLDSSTFYVLGRNETKCADKLDALRNTAPSCKIIFVESQVSLISSIDTAAAKITAAEQKVDYVCVSPGGMPFQGAKCM
jgi:NADP-dependent 3-hydroxy acid dehydrogenase YdfG